MNKNTKNQQVSNNSELKYGFLEIPISEERLCVLGIKKDNFTFLVYDEQKS